MKNLTRWTLTAAVGLLTTAGTVLHAQSWPVAVQFVLQQQDPSTFNNGVYTDKVRSTRLTTADLLTLLADAYATNFPSGFPFGTRLFLVDYDHFQVQAADGSILVTNTSDVLTYHDSYNDGDYLYHGKENTVTEAQSYLFFYQATIQFNDPVNGISFTFSGNLQERYSQSALDRFGYRAFRDSLTVVSGTGSGHSGSNYFLLSGRMTTPSVQWFTKE